MKTLLSLAVILAICVGCMSSNRLVPKTKINWNQNGASIELPKDMEAASIAVSRGSDGVKVDIKDIKVRTNPEAIGAAGTAQSDAIKAVASGMKDTFQMGIEAGKLIGK